MTLGGNAENWVGGPLLFLLILCDLFSFRRGRWGEPQKGTPSEHFATLSRPFLGRPEVLHFPALSVLCGEQPPDKIGGSYPVP